MAAQDTTAVSEWMQENYTQKDYFKPFQEDYTPLLTDLEECPDEPVRGKRWNVPLYMASAFNVRTGAEGGPQAEVKSDSEVQGQVLAQEFKGTIKLTELLERVGTRDAHFNGGALNHQMKQVSSDLAKLMQIHFWGEGTGRLGIIDETQVGVTSFKARLPFSILRMRENMLIDSYDLPTGGTKTTIDGRKITYIDRDTNGDPGGAGYNTFQGVVHFADGGATVTVNAGESIFMKGDYGLAPNGIDGLIGSQSAAGTFLAQSRTTYPKLNTNVDTASSPRAISEELMMRMADRIYFHGCEIDSIRCNAGIMTEVLQLSTNDRRYNVVKGGMPKYIQGSREGDLLFAYDKVTTTIKKDPQCAARQMVFLSFKDTFYKHTTAEVGFLNRGGNILLPVPTAGGGGYDYAFQARLYAACNISNYFPLGNGRIEMLQDGSLAGD